MKWELKNRVFPVGLALLISVGTAAAADSAKVTADDGRTGQLVANVVSSLHINHPEINDDVSERLLKRYVEYWDPQKHYFLQSDIDLFQRSSKQLDDRIRAGDVRFASTVFDRYLLRMGERASLIDRLIDTEHDFTVQEEIVVDADALEWSKTEAEMAERWRKRIKYDLLTLKLADTDLEDTDLVEARKRLHKRYQSNRNLTNQTEAHEVLQAYLSSMTHCLDPHSTYMSPQSVEDFNIAMELKLEGIGARLQYKDGYTVVMDVIEGGAAAANGNLIKGDKIIGVDPDGPGGSEEIIDVVEMKLTKVVDKIRGPSGTQVTLQVKKEEGAVEDYTMKRQTVKLTEDEVKGKIINVSEWIEGQSGRIGVLNIPSFYRDFRGVTNGNNSFKSATRDVKKVLAQFRNYGVDTLIVDLRGNGGGALTEAVELSGLFIPKGPIVMVSGPDNAVTPHVDENEEMSWTKPMVVVCDRTSASASEIFAGAIKDYRRGIVIGDRTTHGKGTVQTLVPLTPRPSLFSRTPGIDRGTLKLTINLFYRVNGESTQKKGVVSDVVLPSILDQFGFDIGEDFLDNALEFDQIKKADYSAFTGLVSDGINEQLAKQSASRVSNDKDFQKVIKNVARSKELKNRKTISLNETTRRTEEEKLKRELEQEKEKIEKDIDSDDDKDIFADDFYNREIVNISVDYAELWNDRRTAGQ